MKLDDQKIKQILLSEDYISEQDARAAQEFAKNNNVAFVDYLFAHNILTKDIFGQAMGENFGVPYIDLAKVKVDEIVFHLSPEEVARAKQVVAFARDDEFVHIGMVNPADLTTKHLISKRVQQNVKIYYVVPDDLQNALEIYSGSIRDKFKQLLAKLNDSALSQDERDELIVSMVDALLGYGYHNKASDIHIEPLRECVAVRFRIDGVMHKVLELPKNLYELILIRIKIMSKMRTDEHRAAQDGKLRFFPHADKRKKEMVDARVSIVPIVEGENVVMRLLSAKSRQFDLADLGFLENNLKKVERAIARPHGMILVTGPTGSGKTTTLYAVLKVLNKTSVHISTIEDPVEYDLEGVSQIQVNPKTNLTFAKGLRAIVRQDPDIIMVGEIRDKETAGVAVNSALTGHLVLSTLHTNDAATTLPRLIDMDVEPFLVASTVNVVIAQRLVRRICQKCRISYIPNKNDLKYVPPELLENNQIKRIYKGNGCKVCANTGYDGRTGIFEVLEITDNIRNLIMNRVASDEINRQAKKEGMQTLFEDGLRKVINGETTLEEVLRVERE